MYAIIFHLDPETLATTYHNDDIEKAHDDIKKTLESHGFTRQQGGVYWGDAKKGNAVSCVLAVMDLARSHPWFEAAVSDIGMLRIEDNTDLMPAVKKAVRQTRSPRRKKGGVPEATPPTWTPQRSFF
jgi:virulence-associated protein VapD